MNGAEAEFAGRSTRCGGGGASMVAMGDGSIPRYGSPRAAYVHVPFCAHRCGYCNFTLVAGRDDLIDAYLTAIERELAAICEKLAKLEEGESLDSSAEDDKSGS